MSPVIGGRFRSISSARTHLVTSDRNLWYINFYVVVCSLLFLRSYVSCSHWRFVREWDGCRPLNGFVK